MILVIEGLPSTTSTSELRELVKLQTNVTDYMLDDLAANEMGYKVARLHVRDSNEGSLIMQVLDGSLYAAHRLRVRPLIEAAQGSAGGGVAYYRGPGGAAAAVGVAGAASAAPAYSAAQPYPAYPAVPATPTYLPMQQVAGSGVGAYGAAIQPVIHSSVAVYRSGYGEGYALPGTDPRAHHYAAPIKSVALQECRRKEEEIRAGQFQRSRPACNLQTSISFKVQYNQHQQKAHAPQQDPYAYQKRIEESRIKDDYRKRKDQRLRSRSPRSRSPPKDRLPRRFRQERRSKSLEKVPPPPPQISKMKRDKSFDRDYNATRKPVARVSKNTEKTFHQAYPDVRDIQQSRRDRVKSLKGRDFDDNGRPERNDDHYAQKAATTVRKPNEIPLQASPKAARSVYGDSDRFNNQTQFETDSHLKRQKVFPTGSVYIESKQSISGSNDNMPNVQRRCSQNDYNLSSTAKSREMHNKGQGNQFNKVSREEPLRTAKDSPRRTPPIELLRYEKSSSNPTQPIRNKKHYQEPMIGKPNDFINKANVQSKNSRTRMRTPSPEPAYRKSVAGKFQTQAKQQTFSKGQTPPLEKRFRKNTNKSFANSTKQSELYNEGDVSQIKSLGPGRHPPKDIDKSSAKNIHPINSHIGNDTKQHSTESKLQFDGSPHVTNKTHFDTNKSVKKETQKGVTDDNPVGRRYLSNNRHREQGIGRPVRDVRPPETTTETTSETRLVWEDVNVLDDQYTPPRPPNKTQVPDDPWAPNSKPNQVDEVPIKARPVMRSAGQVMKDSYYNSNADTRMLYKTNREPTYGRPNFSPEDKTNPPLVQTPPLPDRYVGENRRRIINEKHVAVASTGSETYPGPAKASKQHVEQVGSGRVISREYTEMTNERNFDDRRSRQNKPAYVEKQPLLLDKGPLAIVKKSVIHGYDSREQIPVDYCDPHTFQDDQRHTIRKVHPRQSRENSLCRDRTVRVMPDGIARNTNRRSRSHEFIYAENKERPMTPPRLLQRPMRDEVSREHVAPMVDDRNRDASKYPHRNRRIVEEAHTRQRSVSKYDRPVTTGVVDDRRPAEANIPRSPPPDFYDDVRPGVFEGTSLSPHMYGGHQRPPPDMYDEYQHPHRDMYDDRQRPRHDKFNDRQRPPQDVYDDRQRPSRDVYDDRQRPSREVYDDRQRPSPDVYDDRRQPPRDMYDVLPLPETDDYRQAPPPDMYVDRSSDLRPHDHHIEDRVDFDRRSPYIRPGSPGYEDWKYRDRIVSPERHPRDYYRPVTFDEREMPRDLRFEDDKSIQPLPEYRHEGYRYDSRHNDSYVSPRHRSGDIDAPFDDYFDKKYPERHEFDDRHFHAEVYRTDQPEYPYSPRKSRDERFVEPEFDSRREYQPDNFHEENYHKENFDLRMANRDRDRDVDDNHKSFRSSRTFEDTKRHAQQSIKARKRFVKPFKPLAKFSAPPRMAAKLPPKHLKEVRQPLRKPRKMQNEVLIKKIVKAPNKTGKTEFPINAEDGRYLATNRLAFITMKHHEDLLPNFRLRKRAMIDMRKLIGDRIDRMFKDRFVTNIQEIMKEYRTKYSSKDDTATLKKIIDGLPAFIKTGGAAPKNASQEVQPKVIPKKLSTQSPKKPKEGVSTVKKRPASTLTAKGSRNSEERTLAKKSKMQR